jgi:molybdopterin-containing oxidoreductase family iron-sulfur binding subunit
MVIDLARCIGCQTCAVTCKIENNLPKKLWWNRILTVGGEAMDTAVGVYPNSEMHHLPLNCQHCENPACIKVCPVGATYKDEATGVVRQDYDKCIGCRYCMVACPYSGVRQFNFEEPQYATGFAVGSADVPVHQKNTVEKCTFCAHRLAKGEQPSCIDVCQGRARHFGDLNDPESEVSKLLHQRAHFQLLPEKGTNPSVYFLT